MLDSRWSRKLHVHGRFVLYFIHFYTNADVSVCVWMGVMGRATCEPQRIVSPKNASSLALQLGKRESVMARDGTLIIQNINGIPRVQPRIWKTEYSNGQTGPTG